MSSNQGWLVFVNLLLLCKLSTSSYLCDPSVTPNITSKTPHLPEINSSYVAYMEVWDTDSQKIGYKEEYVDQDSNMAVIRVYGQYDFGDVYTHITDYNTDQVFTIAQTAKGVLCTVTDINSHDLFSLPYIVVNNKKHLVSTPALFKIGSEFAMSYLGPEQVRGKAVNHWQSCFRDNITGVTTMTDIYFTANDWSTANSDDPTPLQTKITQLIPSPNEQDFQDSVQMDFVFFQTSIRDRSIFQLPSGIYCQGRRSSKPVPKIPDHFQFRSEFIALHLHEVGRFDVWYNEKAKIVRSDNTPLPGDDPTSGTTIRDYNTGIEYKIDQQTGSCEVTPILTDNYKSLVVDFKHVGVISATEFFKLDQGNFTYSGQTTVRGINTDTWVGKRVELKNEENTTFIWTWHFSTDEWFSIQYGEDMKTVPIQLTIDSLEKDLHYIYNIYDFIPMPPDLNSFDVTSCYHHVDYHLVYFCLGGDPKVASNLSKLFRNQLVITLKDVMAISVLQISNVKTDLGSTGVCVTFTLHDSLDVTGNTIGTISSHTSTSDSISALKKFIDVGTKFLLTNNNVSISYMSIPWSLRDEIHYANGSVSFFFDSLITKTVSSTEDVHQMSETTVSSTSMTTTVPTDIIVPSQSGTIFASSSTGEVTQAFTREITQGAELCAMIDEEHAQPWSIGRIAGLSVGVCLGGVVVGVLLARFTSKCRINVKLKRSERFTRGGLDHSMM